MAGMQAGMQHGGNIPVLVQHGMQMPGMQGLAMQAMQAMPGPSGSSGSLLLWPRRRALHSFRQKIQPPHELCNCFAEFFLVSAPRKVAPFSPTHFLDIIALEQDSWGNVVHIKLCVGVHNEKLPTTVIFFALFSFSTAESECRWGPLCCSAS